MKSRTTPRFRECLSKLPEHIQEQARNAYRRFALDPYHPGLRFKTVHPTQPIYSVRITRGYRAVGVLKDDEIIWFWIGAHDEYLRVIC